MGRYLSWLCFVCAVIVLLGAGLLLRQATGAQPEPAPRPTAPQLVPAISPTTPPSTPPPPCGLAWRMVPSPNVVQLRGVAALATNDVWAVGGYPTTLIVHWDGTTWSVVSSPPTGGELNAVAAVAANDIWAV